MVNWLVETLRGNPELAIFLALGAGYWLGAIKFGSFSLGSVTGTLLAGILVWQLGIEISPQVKSVFFMLFLFAVGYGVGPQFVRGVARDGVPQALFAVVICLLVLACVVVASVIAGYDPGFAAGLHAGSQTISASIGLANDAINGLDASAVPSPQAVAAALAACRLAGVPLKATQGLHQPLRHLDGGLGATVHGFLNLLVAGVLGHLHALSERELLAIVEEVEAAAFRFDDNGLAWAGLAAGLDAIAAGRRAAVTSFGSCSFAEPRDALRELGLLDRGGPTASRSGPERGGRTTENGTD